MMRQTIVTLALALAPMVSLRAKLFMDSLDLIHTLRFIQAMGYSSFGGNARAIYSPSRTVRGCDNRRPREATRKAA